MKNLARWDPFKVARRWDPFDDFRELQYEMDRLLNRMTKEIPEGSAFGTWMPAVESYTRDNNLMFKCELPGVDPKEVDVTVDETGHQLVIKGERKTEKDTKEEDYLRKEITYGTFERRFPLPEGIKTDGIKAKFDKGILEITVPAPQIAGKARRIEIESPPVIEGEKKDVKKAA